MRAIFNCLVMGPAVWDVHVTATLEHWSSWVEELSDRERALKDAMKAYTQSPVSACTGTIGTGEVW